MGGGTRIPSSLIALAGSDIEDWLVQPNRRSLLQESFF